MASGQFLTLFLNIKPLKYSIHEVNVFLLHHISKNQYKSMFFYSYLFHIESNYLLWNDSFLFAKKHNYHILYFSPSSFLVFKKGVVPCFYKDFLLHTFKDPPKFWTVHEVTVGNGILVCSYVFKERYGISYRHLFCIEPNYNTKDIHYKCKKAYSVYYYLQGKRDITQAYKK